MTIQLIRNATMKITYGGMNFLTDPILAEKGIGEDRLLIPVDGEKIEF